jgi:hypothetical protein
MKKVALLLFGAIIIMAAGNKNSLNIGDSAPLQKEKMKDISGKQMSLADAKSENGLLVIFSCNTCP